MDSANCICGIAEVEAMTIRMCILYPMCIVHLRENIDRNDEFSVQGHAQALLLLREAERRPRCC